MPKFALPRIAAVAALLLALVAFAFGAAPFTPALALAVAALPIAIICAALGAWRLSALAAYWSVAALLVVPLHRFLPMRPEALLLSLGIVGLVLALVLLRGYRRNERQQKTPSR